PPGYYFRAGTGGGKNMWHIYLPGGAWCGSAAQCVARSKTLFGTSTLYPADPEPGAALRPPFNGMLSSNSSINPPFYNWNLVRLLYCDGGGYAGTAGRVDVGNGTVLYLDGWKIVQAVIEDLKSKRGIKSAAQILLSGSSAGGQAVVALCDRIAAAFPWAATKCISDSGFFIDSKDRVGGYTWRTAVKSIVALHKPSWPACQDEAAAVPYCPLLSRGCCCPLLSLTVQRLLLSLTVPYCPEAAAVPYCPLLSRGCCCPLLSLTVQRLLLSLTVPYCPEAAAVPYCPLLSRGCCCPLLSLTVQRLLLSLTVPYCPEAAAVPYCPLLSRGCCCPLLSLTVQRLLLSLTVPYCPEAAAVPYYPEAAAVPYYPEASLCIAQSRPPSLSTLPSSSSPPGLPEADQWKSAGCYRGTVLMHGRA
ncbi:unnamed protein product, partial [Closterium sp. Naga37s-1]